MAKVRSPKTENPRVPILSGLSVKQPFSGPDLSVLEGMKCPFLDFTYLLMC